jgi:prepilin peptidase CpaA
MNSVQIWLLPLLMREEAMLLSNKEALYLVIALVCALAAAIPDMRHRRIPNRLIICTLPIGLAVHFAIDGWRGLFTSGAAGLAAGLIFLIFFLAGGMGGGDVKLICVVASIAGLKNLPDLLVFTSLAGGVMAIVLALKHRRLRSSLLNMKVLFKHHRDHGLTAHPQLNVQNANAPHLPYAVAIAAGCLATIYVPGAMR